MVGAIFKWLQRRWHPWRFARKRLVGLLRAAPKLAMILAIGGYGTVIFIHLTNGFSFQSSLGAGFQDARLFVTCPRDVSLQWQFIDRSQIEQVGLAVSINMGDRVYNDICSSGALLPVRLAERGKKEIDARAKGLVKPQQPDDSSLTPTPVLTAPEPPLSVTPRPDLLPALTTTPSDLPLLSSVPTHTRVPIPTSILTSTAAQTLADLRLHLLHLTNLDRAANGLSPVTLGDNTAAQQHAEEILEHSYLSHWGLDGLKPYMRYTLMGGVNYEAENVAGITNPIKLGLLYRRISPKDELVDIQQAWMGSEGHRVNILNPWHKKVSLGIACNRITCAAIQQFEGDYLSFQTEPTLSSGRLVMAGRLSGGFEFRSIQIWYDQLPQPLTLGQLDTTYCYSRDRPVAFLREAAPAGTHYLGDSSAFSWDACHSPFDAPEDTPRLGLDAFKPRPYIHGSEQVPWIAADLWQVVGDQFNIQADVSEVLTKNGPGVYTVHIWGDNAGEKVALSNYSIFYKGE